MTKISKEHTKALTSGQSRASLKRKKSGKNQSNLAGEMLHSTAATFGREDKHKDIDKEDHDTPRKKSKTDKTGRTSNEKAVAAGSSSSKKVKASALEHYDNNDDVSDMTLLDILHLEEPKNVTSNQRAAMLMSKLITPTSRETFYMSNWEQKPLLVERMQSSSSKHSQFKGIFSRKAFKAILQDYAAYYGVDVDVSKLNTQGSKSFVGTVVDNDAPTTAVDGIIASVAQLEDVEAQAVRVKPADVWRCSEQGYAVRLLSPQKCDDVLWSFLAALEHEFGCAVGCEADLLRGSCQGYVATVDTADSIVIQLSGETRWRLWAPLPGSELPQGDTFDCPLDDADAESGQRKADLDRLLRAGDTLYIPKGWGYATVSNSKDMDVESLHLRIHTNRGNSVIDLLALVVPTAVDVVSKESSVARQGLPRSYQNYLGVPYSELEVIHPQREHFIQRASKQLTAIMNASLAMVDAGADQMAKKFLSERLPVPLTEEEEARTAAGASDARIFMYTRLRMLRPGIARVLIEDGACVVYHCMDNSREKFGAPLQPLEFELDDGPAIEALLQAYPGPVSVADLPHPSEEDDDKLSLAQALFKEGILVIDDDASKPQAAGAGSDSEDSDDPF